MSSEVAKVEEIPSHYLAKILQRMVKYGFVESHKGRGGGFRITELALDSSILEILEKVEGPIITHKCVTGLKECADENPCPLHEEWSKLRNSIHNLISSKSVKEVAEEFTKTLQRKNN